MIYIVNAYDHYYPDDWNVVLITKDKEEAEGKILELQSTRKHSGPDVVQLRTIDPETCKDTLEEDWWRSMQNES